jgi:hypothetical protein
MIDSFFFRDKTNTDSLLEMDFCHLRVTTFT